MRTSQRLTTNAVLIGIFALASVATARADWQDVDAVRDAAVRSAQESAAAGDRIEATVDDRVQLPQCEQPLEASRAATSASALTVAVGCAQPSWKIYVPVRISASRDVIVAARSLARGQAVTADMLRAERRELSSLGTGYLTRRELAIGQQLTHPVSEGRVLTVSDLTDAPAVHRGQQVVLVGHAGGLEVRSTGKVLADAALGSRVSVENASSRRVVEGTVRSADVVEVGL